MAFSNVDGAACCHDKGIGTGIAAVVESDSLLMT